MSITEFEKIQFYLAPMESVTGYVYRNAYHAMFGDMNKYVMPFIAPSKKNIEDAGAERRGTGAQSGNVCCSTDPDERCGTVPYDVQYAGGAWLSGS